MAVNKRPAEKKAETNAKKRKQSIVDAMNTLSDIANEKEEGFVLIVKKKKKGGFDTKGGAMFMNNWSNTDMGIIVLSLATALVETEKKAKKKSK